MVYYFNRSSKPFVFMWTVYKHTTPSGKVYIGITSRPTNERWQNGFGYSNQVFFNAILKYGWDNIKHEIIAENLDEDTAKQMEIELIAKYKDNSYNITAGGEGVRRPCPPEVREKISKANMGHPGKRGPENHFYGAFGELNPFFGKHHSEETRQLLRELGKRYIGKSNPMYGKHHSEETKRKIAEKATGRKVSPETKLKISELHKGKRHHMYGKHHSKETVNKISRTLTGRQLSECHKASISKAMSSTCWVYKGGKNKRIKQEDLSKYIEMGYIHGRIYKPIK